MRRRRKEKPDRRPRWFEAPAPPVKDQEGHVRPGTDFEVNFICRKKLETDRTLTWKYDKSYWWRTKK